MVVTTFGYKTCHKSIYEGSITHRIGHKRKHIYTRTRLKGTVTCIKNR